MSKQEHEYAQVLRWIADGEEVQWANTDGDYCTLCSLEQFVNITNGMNRVKRTFRLKPRTISINGHDISEPLRSAPADGACVWLADQDQDDLVYGFRWEGDEAEMKWFTRGLCHASREAAEAHACALLSFTTTEVK